MPECVLQLFLLPCCSEPFSETEEETITLLVTDCKIHYVDIHLTELPACKKITKLSVENYGD